MESFCRINHPLKQILHRSWSLFRPHRLNLGQFYTSYQSCQKLSTNTRKIEEFTIPVPGGHIACKASGNQHGIPILGIHGYLDSAATFDRLQSLLSQDIYFVALDLPGHGLSSHIPPGAFYTYLQFVLATRRVVQHLKWDTFSIVGHSMGAGIGALYSSVFHESVKNLVLLDQLKNWTLSTPGNGYANNARKSIDAYLAVEESMKKKSQAVLYGEAKGRLMGPAASQLDESALKILMKRGSRKVDDDKYELIRDARLKFNCTDIIRYTNDDIFDIMSNIKCRVLHLQAKAGLVVDDEAITERAIALYKEKCLEFKQVNLPGNHFMHLLNPDGVADEINKFVIG